MSNLFSRFQQNFPANTQQVFLYEPDGNTITYAEMLYASAQWANYFYALGLGKGDRIVVQLEKSSTALMVYLAALRAGLIYVPLNTAYTDAEMAYFIDDAQPSLLLCDPSKQGAIQAILTEQGAGTVLRALDQAAQAAWLTEVQAQAADFCNVDSGNNDTAAILYTSGTTGRPKGAMLSHANLRANAYTLKAMWGFDAEDVLLHALPIFHVHGLFVAIHCVLAAGASLILLPNFEPKAVMQALPKATVFMGVPTFYTRLLAQPGFNTELCLAMRLFISGSAPMLASTHRAFEEATGHKILERYGMTETGMLVSNPLQGERRAGTVGFPLPEVLVRIVDSANHPVESGQIGSIQVKGPNVFQAYWRKPDKTAQEFTDDGYFITGDQGRLSDDGYISIVGRVKDMVITGGFNVYPKEVELVLDALAGVKESAVIGLPHPDFGEAVTAVIVVDAGADVKLSEATIIALAKVSLADFKTPKKVFFVEALPRNTMGKVQKNSLREQYAHLYQSNS